MSTSMSVSEARRVLREHERRMARRRGDDPRLRRAEAAYKKAQARADELRIARNDAIMAALADGFSKADVARITGLGQARIGQLVKAHNDEAPARGNARGTTTHGGTP